ncbi:Meprin A subunit alpha [Folsomia candida]|uniref:Metalloendopeptidase n=1 Tax=Folsomia candida TaxID=158441 RepID=A0A226D2U3_FOLCA|nr:Meprin A subunit alpha [Folsomia candida]
MIGQRGAVFVDLHMVAMSQKLALFIVSAFFVGIVSSGKGGQGRERRSLVHYAQGDAIQDGRPMGSLMKMGNSEHEEKLAELIKKPKHYEEIVAKEKAKPIVTDFVESVAPSTRGATTDLSKKWDYKMTIVIAPEFSDEAREMLLSAIYTLSEALKCFQFYVTRKGVTLPSRKDHLVISRDRDGCLSMLGKQSGQQFVFLGERCNLYGTAIHEIIHALGFYHEHTRPDRDNYVTVDWSQIKTANGKLQFKISDQNYPKEYDFDSLMHYPFSPILQPLPGKVPPGARPGQRDHLSKNDIMQLQALYPCSNSPFYRKK